MNDKTAQVHLVELTEDGLARVFVRNRVAELRFAHDVGRWFKWDGQRWQPQNTQLAFHMARIECRSHNTDGKAVLAKASTAYAIEKFARADPRVALVGDEFDTNAFLIATGTGTVDLRTGTMRKADPADLITRSTLVAPEEGEPKLWMQFLDQVTRQDKDLQRFLQTVAGYCLTGSTKEEVLFFLYGVGGSGKSTFVNALLEIFADYGTSAAMETFVASKYDQHPTDLAAMRGFRMVVASETQSGRSWNEQRLKTLTGGDVVKARFMRQDFFDYRPNFKLVVMGNHRPILHNVDSSLRRRFRIVPFMYQPKAPDLELKAKLRGEYPKILHWAIEGCLIWQREGLVIPKCVQEETSLYFESSDMFADWIDLCCDIKGTYAASNSDLFKSWSGYCTDIGESAGSSRTHADRLNEMGLRRIKNTNGVRGRGFLGIRLKPSAEDYEKASRGD